MPTLYYHSLLLISLICFCGAIVYRLYQLNYSGIFLTLFLVVITFIIAKKKDKVKESIKNYELGIKNDDLLWIFLYILLLLSNFVTLFNSRVNESIISPWQAIPWYFFLIFIASTIIITHLIIKNSLPMKINWLLVTGYWLLILSIALIIYEIGYGFDPFIHQATEKLIAAQGFVDPKPLYYLGQYSLIVILHKLTFIPIVWLDKLLVPLLAALFLPYALFNAIKTLCASQRASLLTTLFILIFPFSTFIATTPQNLANLFLIIIILLSIQISQNEKLVTGYWLLIALSLATAAIHPIAGIPAIFFIAMLAGKKIIKIKKLVAGYRLLVTAATAAALPAAFYLNNKTNAVINSAADTGAAPLWQLPQLFFSGTENFILNFTYLYGFNIVWILLFFIISGIIIYYKKIPDTKYKILNTPYILMSVALLFSYFLTKYINFSYLINYEQSSFADRVLIIAAYFALPFILITLSALLNKILRQEKIVKYSLLCFFAILLSCSLYISYPRRDNYYNSRSFSTSAADLEAARWINENAKKENFIVLANQQVSAAALNEFGFKKYYDTAGGKIFYYPIPTGEKLYQYYLDMVYENANKKTALEAADLAGADTAYFVINDYWFAFEKILSEAKIEADEIKKIDNGQIYIFKYKKNSDTN